MTSASGFGGEQAARARGAYGFRLNLDGRLLLQDPPGTWPEASIHARIGRPEQHELTLGETKATIPLVEGGLLEAGRDPLSATYTFRQPMSGDDLVHPYLAASAGLFAQWCGFESFHSGGVVVGSATWAVLGGRQLGKSTLLAWVAHRGLPVVTDDILIVRGTTVFAGPRCVDLRTDSFDRLSPALVGDPVRSASRKRVLLGTGPAESELAGWIQLEWGDGPTLTEVPLAERMRLLAGSRAFPHARPDQRTFLNLAAKPMFTLTRPRDWGQLDDVLDLLLTRLGR